jgi:hypothetical protein
MGLDEVGRITHGRGNSSAAGRGLPRSRFAGRPWCATRSYGLGGRSAGELRTFADRGWAGFGERRRLGGADHQDVRALPARPSATTGRAA